MKVFGAFNFSTFFRFLLSDIWAVSSFSILSLFFSPSLQIISKLKRQSNPGVKANIEDICERIFELVDKNNDSEFQVDPDTKSSTNPFLFPLILEEDKLLWSLWLCSSCQWSRSDFFGGVYRRGWEGPLGDGAAQTGHRALWVVHGTAGEETLTS